MRPVAKLNSSLKVPLNEILGYQANIRVLRCLTDEFVSMSYSELARQTGISLPGIHKTIQRLTETGIVVLEGSGKQQLIKFRNEHPLAVVITKLFKGEKERFKNLKQAIRQEIDKLRFEIMAAWIHGKVAEGRDQYGDPLEVAILGKADSIDLAVNELREHLINENIEVDFDVTIEINGMTSADLQVSKKTLKGKNIHLFGVDPILYAEGRDKSGGKEKDHQDMDRLSLRAGKAWAAFIRQHPELISRTIQLLDTRIEESDSSSKKELQEWRKLLKSTSLQRLIKFLESDSERAIRMRQSNPFWLAISDEEKEEYEKFLENTDKK